MRQRYKYRRWQVHHYSNGGRRDRAACSSSARVAPSITEVSTLGADGYFARSIRPNVGALQGLHPYSAITEPLWFAVNDVHQRWPRSQPEPDNGGTSGLFEGGSRSAAAAEGAHHLGHLADG